jgi:hypothetical protein
VPVYSARNEYPGINPHLNSFLQQEDGGWESFHSDYITALRMALDVALPPGYLALSEKSLQIGALGSNSSDWLPLRSRPDVTLFQTPISGSAPSNSPLATAEPTQTFLLTDLLEGEPDDQFRSAVIYRLEEGSLIGRAVTRIELLSPANKPGGSYHARYLVKRDETLRSGLRMVEIDLLHETPPILDKIPDYRAVDVDAFPYHLLISDPRPTVETGTARYYGFGVDDPLRPVAVPLEEEDQVVMDFGAVYHQLYATSRFFSAVVDYKQPPVNVDRYREQDQTRILARMAIITRGG